MTMTDRSPAQRLEHDVLALKKRLREVVRGLLSALSEQEREKRSGIIREKIEKDAVFAKAKTVMLFWPLKDEPDVRPLIELAAAQGKNVCLPKIEAGTMSAYRWSGTGGLIRNDLGVMEPDGKAERVSEQSIDCVIVPGRAFSRSGRRLGRGGGFYDRFLTQAAPNASALGVCFACQLFDDIPCGEHDRTVHSVFSA